MSRQEDRRRADELLRELRGKHKLTRLTSAPAKGSYQALFEGFLEVIRDNFEQGRVTAEEIRRVLTALDTMRNAVASLQAKRKKKDTQQG